SSLYPPVASSASTRSFTRVITSWVSRRIAAGSAPAAVDRSKRRTASSVKPAHSSSRSLGENPCPFNAALHSRTSSWTRRSRSAHHRRARLTKSGRRGGARLLLHQIPDGIPQVGLPATGGCARIDRFGRENPERAAAVGLRAHLGVDLDPGHPVLARLD